MPASRSKGPCFDPRPGHGDFLRVRDSYLRLSLLPGTGRNTDHEKLSTEQNLTFFADFEPGGGQHCDVIALLKAESWEH